MMMMMMFRSLPMKTVPSRQSTFHKGRPRPSDDNDDDDDYLGDGNEVMMISIDDV